MVGAGHVHRLHHPGIRRLPRCLAVGRSRRCLYRTGHRAGCRLQPDGWCGLELRLAVGRAYLEHHGKLGDGRAAHVHPHGSVAGPVWNRSRSDDQLCAAFWQPAWWTGYRSDIDWAVACRKHRHRCFFGHAAGTAGSAGDAATRLRSITCCRHRCGSRDARHPDSAQHHAGDDGRPDGDERR